LGTHDFAGSIPVVCHVSIIDFPPHGKSVAEQHSSKDMRLAVNQRDAAGWHAAKSLGPRPGRRRTQFEPFGTCSSEVPASPIMVACKT
jgi:hypothetical protein